MVAMALRVGLLLGCLAPSAAAQCMKWVLRTDVANPGPQVGHAMAYHSDRQRVVIFTSDVAADLWEYDGFQWLRVSVTGPRPSPRLDSAMAYDRARQELVLVGGFGRAENTELADTWTCRLTTDAAGHVLGSWTRRADFPDHALPDEDDPAGQMGESGARTEHSLVYDESRQVVRLFGGKARIIRGSKWQRPYNRENYSAGNGTWTGSAWVDRQWRNPRAITEPDPEHVPVIGVLHFRHELGRKLIASTYDGRRQRTVTFGGLRQIYQSRDEDSLAATRVDEAYIESLPDLQYFVESSALGSQNFPSTSRQILYHSQGRCGYDDTERIFGSQLVYDTWRDRYVAFGGGFVTGERNGGIPCAKFYGVDTSEFRSQLASDSFREWDPRRPSPPDSHGNVRLPLIDRGGAILPTPPASRIRHTMVFDEHRGVTVMYGGWDGTTPSLETVARQTWEYAPNEVGFAEEPAALSELCLGEPMTLKVRPLSALPRRSSGSAAGPPLWTPPTPP